MRRRWRWFATGLFGTAIAVVLLFVAAGWSLRAKRHESGVPEKITTRILHVRNFLADLYGARVGERVVLFDAGMDPDGRALDVLLHALSAKPEDVSDIFLTHDHFDHVAAAARCPSARVHIGAADAEVLAQRAPARAFVPRLFATLLRVPPIEPTERLTAVTDVELGAGDKVLALPFPGHTPGSYLYLFGGVLFTGDSIAIAGGKLAADSAPRVGPVDSAERCRTTRQLAALLAENRVSAVCTGHMGCTRQHEAQRLLGDFVSRQGERCPP